MPPRTSSNCCALVAGPMRVASFFGSPIATAPRADNYTGCEVLRFDLGGAEPPADEALVALKYDALGVGQTTTPGVKCYVSALVGPNRRPTKPWSPCSATRCV